MIGTETSQQRRVRLVHKRDADRAALHFAGLNQRVVNGAGGVGGDSEADAVIRSLFGSDSGVDSDHLPRQVHQRTAAVAGINGGIGLKEVLELSFDSRHNVAALGADDACRHGGFKPERTSDRQHPVTHFDR